MWAKLGYQLDPHNSPVILDLPYALLAIKMLGRNPDASEVIVSEAVNMICGICLGCVLMR